MTAFEPSELARLVLPAPLWSLMDERIGAWPKPTPMAFQQDLNLWLKREDLGAVGTHKSRGLSLQILSEVAEGARGFAVSSSGNAALAAAVWSRRLGMTCLSFLSDKTPTGKIEAVAQVGAPTIVTAKPINLSRYAARYGGLVNLRPSQHHLGAMGYRLLAAELALKSPVQPTSVFCFCNSGLTIAGLHDGFERLVAAGEMSTAPQLHAVQCCEPGELAVSVGAQVRPQEAPVAGALGAQVPPDLQRVSRAITSTGGSVWMVTNDEVNSADRSFRGARVDAAVESAAALAGFERARSRWDLGKSPVAVVAGRRFGAEVDTTTIEGVRFIDDYGQVRALLHELGFGREGRSQ